MPDLYFGVQAGYPIVGGLHFGMRNVITDSLGRAGWVTPCRRVRHGLLLFYEFEEVFGVQSDAVHGPGVVTRVGAGAALDWSCWLEWSTCCPVVPSLFAELGPAFARTFSR